MPLAPLLPTQFTFPIQRPHGPAYALSREGITLAPVALQSLTRGQVYNQRMYTMRSTLNGQPIISLQTGQIVSWVHEPILEFSALEVVALSCSSARANNHLIVICRDIRQYAADCVIVDSEDELTDPEDIARLSSSLKTHYSPIDKPVQSESGSKLGTVEDYSINLETNRLQKLHVRRSFFRALFGSNLIIDRTQIVDVTLDRITVRDATTKSTVLATESVPEM